MATKETTSAARKRRQSRRLNGAEDVVKLVFDGDVRGWMRKITLRFGWPVLDTNNQQALAYLAFHPR
jgi:hypothetical protein